MHCRQFVEIQKLKVEQHPPYLGGVHDTRAVTNAVKREL